MMVSKYRPITGDELFGAVMLITLTVGFALFVLPFIWLIGHRQTTYLGHFCKTCGIKQ